MAQFDSSSSRHVTTKVRFQFHEIQELAKEVEELYKSGNLFTDNVALVIQGELALKMGIPENEPDDIETDPLPINPLSDTRLEVNYVDFRIRFGAQRYREIIQRAKELGYSVEGYARRCLGFTAAIAGIT